MRKNLMLCLISAVVGGALATVLYNQPNPPDRVAAAEPPRGPLRSSLRLLRPPSIPSRWSPVPGRRSMTI